MELVIFAFVAWVAYAIGHTVGSSSKKPAGRSHPSPAPHTTGQTARTAVSSSSTANSAGTKPAAAGGSTPAQTMSSSLLAESNSPQTPSPTSTPRGAAWEVNFVLDERGKPVSSVNEEEWLNARRSGITASDARRLLKQNGQPSASQASIMDAKLNPQPTPVTSAMAYGVEREPQIARWVAKEFNIFHNTYLCRGFDAHHLATPDGIGDRVISEIKSSTKTWQENRTNYQDQIQWQLHVTGAEKCLLVKEDPATHKIQYGWIARDEARIRMLGAAADEVLFNIRARRAVGTQHGSDISTARPTTGFEDEIEWVEEFLAEMDNFDRETQEAELTQGIRQVFDEEKIWTPSESAELLKLYRSGLSISKLSQTFSVIPVGVVRELSSWLVVTEGELVDSSARNFGSAWTQEDLAKIKDLYEPSTSISPLAQALGRDQLAIAFKLFEFRIPEPSVRLINRLEERS